MDVQQLVAERDKLAAVLQSIRDGTDEKQSEIEDEICSEARAEGHSIGFDRCLELVEWACLKIEMPMNQIRRVQSLLSEGPPLGSVDSPYRDLLAERDALLASVARLRAAAVWALAKFTDPESLDRDPAAVKLKALCEAALAPTA